MKHPKKFFAVVQSAAAALHDLFPPFIILKKNVTYNNVGFMRVAADVLRNKDTFFITLAHFFVTMRICGAALGNWWKWLVLKNLTNVRKNSKAQTFKSNKKAPKFGGLSCGYYRTQWVSLSNQTLCEML